MCHSKINNNVEVCHVVSICILKQMCVFNLFVRNKAIIKISFHCIIFLFKLPVVSAFLKNFFKILGTKEI